MKYNNNTRNNSLFVKLFASLAMFVVAVASVFALPGITSTNLQTTAGVNVTGAGNTLNITAPDKSVLTWQAFGSGADTIAITDTLNYALPSKNASVLNIVAGGANTTIDGAILSNGNVYVLNPNGIVIGGGARIDTNRFYLGTSDNPAFASYYFAQNGKLPSQDGLAPIAGNTTVNANAIIKATENITIVSKNVTIGGAFFQGNTVLTADGNLAVGSNAMVYVDGDLTLNNNTGGTLLGSTGNSLLVTGNLTSTGGVTSTFGTVNNAASIQAKSVAITGGTIVADKINTNNLVANGSNVTVNVGNVTTNPVVSVTSTGNVLVTAPSTLSLNVTNTSAAGTTTATAAGALSLNRIQIGSNGATSFTGTTVSDVADGLFVYGPVGFNATTGNVSITKAKHSFGAVSVSAPLGEATVFEDAATQLNVVNTPKLTLKSGDFVFQTAGTGVIGSANTSITGLGNITLGAAGNAGGTYVVSGKDVTLTTAGATTATLTGGNIALSSNGAVTLNNVAASGTLGVSSTGAIAQAADTKVDSVGATTFLGTGLTLANSGNAFGGLTVDVGLAGAANINEETTLNLVSLRAGAVTLKSAANVITTGLLPVSGDTFSLVVGGDFVPAANFRAVNGVTILAGGNVDLSALSLATSLNAKTPSVIAKGYKAPQP